MNSQDGIDSVTRTGGNADIRPCADADGDGTDECGEVETSCDITVLVPATYKDTDVGEAAEGRIFNEEQDFLSYRTMWDGSAIHYTVENKYDEEILFNWSGTPFAAEIIGPHAVVTRSVPAHSQPEVLGGVVDVERLSTGVVMRIDAVTTYIPSSLELTTDVQEPAVAQQNGFRLLQNVPNPMSAETELRYEVPEAAHVEIAVYNTVGDRVRTLVSEFVPAGTHRLRWNGSNDAGVAVSGGTYFYRLVSSSGDGNPVVLSQAILLIR